MTFSITIAGVQKYPRAGTLHISQTANGRTTASFELLSEDRSYRPALDAEVIITADGTRIFGGLVDTPTERGMFKGSHPGIITSISAVDFHAYTDRRYVAELIPAGTLKAALIVVTTYLAGYGVTLHASQVDGPPLPALDYTGYRSVTEVLNEFATLTASTGGSPDAAEPYVWRIDNFKVLRMYQPSTVPAPFDLVGNDLPEVIGDIEVESTRGDYANTIIVKVKPKTFLNFQESKEGDGTWDTWVLSHEILAHRNFVVVLPDGAYDPTGGFWEPLGDGHPTGPTWMIGVDNKTLTRLTGVLADGYTAWVTYDWEQNIVVTAVNAAEVAANGIWERLLLVEDIPDEATAQALADAELAKRVPVTRTARYHTFEEGIVTGMQQLVNVSARNVNETAVVTDVVIRDFGKDRLQRQVTVVVDAAQTNLGRGWRDVYKAWLGDKTGGAALGTVVGPTTNLPVTVAPPDTAVQFNDGGVFGGDEFFTFNKNTNSIVCGLDSTITAADPESCQVFGNDCHIADA